MVKFVLPADATDQSVTWSVVDVSGSATINAAGILTAVTNGTVVVKAITNDGSDIETTDIITISNQTSGLNEDIISTLYLYPNPANQSVNLINVNGKQITLISLDGKVIKKEKSLTHSYTLDVSTVEPGTYMVYVMDENNQSIIEKLIIK